MRQKILILAGSHFQIPVIRYAKNKGCFVITCDNKPDNPGHSLADKYYNISTTDLNSILEISIKEKIDGILAYGSDIAAPAAAYVSEILEIPGNNYNSVQILTDKGKFRSFLKESGFPVPEFKVFTQLSNAEEYVKDIDENVYIKPVDSSGSKGVSKLSPGSDIKKAFDYAMLFSRKKEVIIEREILRKDTHIHGEGFVFQGELKFMLLGDQYFSRINPCAPLSTTLPGVYHNDIIDEIRGSLISLLNKLKFHTGGLNIEIIRDVNDKIYFVELGPRNGGNFMPDLAQMATGMDLAAANVNAVLGKDINLTFSIPDEENFFTQLILHSHRDGKYLKPNIPDKFGEFETASHIYFKNGQLVNKYRGSQDVIGVKLYKFPVINCYMEFIDFIKNNEVVTLNC